ncbi:hypothetical protein F8388_019876 [Cannabis sativa]|uniref:TF-B3 domain-containing protein n=1 Tax=Cannabis sativa TaxID=3483 RepID=A0A7J6H5S5_CANSA|nr:hypothetical protein F8388_019876 [Cannabis sativa]
MLESLGCERYCESLSNQVFRKLPCGSTEETKLTKSSDGKEHNVDIDDSNENSDSRPNKIRKTSPYDNSEAANKTKSVSEANTDHDNQGTATNNNNKRPSSEAATKFFTNNPYFQVKLRAHQLRGNGNLRPEYKFSSGWAAFARDNFLQKTDVCFFELINKNQPAEIKVTIFRQSKSSMAQQ